MIKLFSKLFCIFFCLSASVMTAMAQPKSEVRAVWLTTNSGLDWPNAVYTEAEQKAALIDILDKLEAARFNTVVFQVQVKGDVLWDSKIQPFLMNVSGNGAKSITWDVCKYVIDECHKRNME